MDPHHLYSAHNYLYSSTATVPAVQNYLYSQATPSSADPAQYYAYSQPAPSAAQNYVYSQPPPPAAQNYLYSSSAQHYALNNVYSHPQPPAVGPVQCTPMSPYSSQNPQPPIPDTVYQSSSINLCFPQNAHYPLPQSHAITNASDDDDYLRRIRNEVIFLHALWDQGPPHSPNYSNFTSHLKPSPTTLFKKTKKTHKGSDNPWPVPPESSAPPGWPQLPSRPTPPNDDNIARVSPAKVQRKALDSFRTFFTGNHGPLSDCESDDDDCDDDQDQGDVSAKFDQFCEVFDGDQELRDYYLKNWENGEFLCLVCGASGQKVGRKYKNSLALVQHTVTVSKTKKKKAHRAYAQVICKVLGWDINQLPLVSRNLCLQQGNGMSSVEACKDDPVVVETSIAPIVGGKDQLDPSEATSAEKKETSDLAMILENSWDQQGNAMSSSEACKDDPVVVETSIALSVSGNEQSDPSKATSDLGKESMDISVEKKEASDLSLMLDNPAGQQIDTVNSADTSRNHPDISEEKTDAIINKHVLSDPPSSGSDIADDNAAEKNATSALPCTVMVMGSQGGSADTQMSVDEPAT